MYYYNENAPTTSTYGCRLCRDNYDRFKLNSIYKTGMSRSAGILQPVYKKNVEKISKHSELPGHKSVIKNLILEQENLIKKNYCCPSCPKF